LIRCKSEEYKLDGESRLCYPIHNPLNKWVKGIIGGVQLGQNKRDSKPFKLVLTGLMAALCYVSFTFLKIPIPVPSGTGYTALHIGNAFCVLAALIMGGTYGGLAGSIGMTISDLTDPVYVVSAPKTFVLKFLIGYIAGTVAHKCGHITAEHDKKYVLKWSLLSSLAGLLFNVAADPFVGYLYKRFLLGMDADASKIMAAWDAGASLINALVGTVVVVAVYAALRPVLKKTGLFFEI